MDGFVAESPVPKTQVADEVFLVWQVLGHAILKNPELTEVLNQIGAPSGTRTRDTLIKSQVLYQLS